MKKINARAAYLLERISFGNLSVKNKFLLVFAFVLIAMILLSTIIYSFYIKDKEQATLDFVIQMNEQTLNKVDSFIDMMSNLTKVPLLTDENNNDSKIFTALKTSNITGTIDLASQRKFDNETFNMLMLDPSLHSVFIFNRYGKGGYTLSGMDLAPTRFNPYHEKWFQKSLEGNGSALVISSFYLPVSTDFEEKLVFSVSRGLKDVDEGTMIGVILINAKIEILDRFMKDMAVYPTQMITLADQDGNVFYDLDRTKITGKLDPNIAAFLANEQTNSQRVTYQGRECILSYKKSSASNLTIINLIPVKELNENLNKINIATLFVTITIVIASLVIVVVVSSLIVRPLKKLTSGMHQFESGNFDIRIHSKQLDEIGELSHSFDNMAGEIQRLINEVYISSINQKDLELQMLKIQINPHFLYNTLESIRMVAEVAGNDKVCDMLCSLSNILRYSISLPRETVSVKEEIDRLKDYILLQTVRFDGLFSIELDIDERLYDKVILKLLLQPILENAINHGLKDRASDGRIRILGCIRDGKAIFEITDNGVGMDGELVQTLNDYVHGLNDSRSSIGLRNVHRRIELYYGAEYGLHIESRKGHGTTVTVVLPL